MANDHPLSREHATTQQAGAHEETADIQQRAALRQEGDGTRSQGLISPSRRTFSTAPAGVLSSGAYAFHCSPHQLTRVQHVPAGKKTT